MVWSYEKFKNVVQFKIKPEDRHDPSKAVLPAYYPDTKIIRKTVARFDCVTAMDQEVSHLKTTQRRWLREKHHCIFLQ